MLFDVTSFVLGAMLGAGLLAAIAFPRIGRILTRLVAVVLLAVSVGMLTWATVAVSSGSQLTRIVWQPLLNIGQPSEVYGWGGGLLVAGALTLAFSFMRSRD